VKRALRFDAATSAWDRWPQNSRIYLPACQLMTHRSAENVTTGPSSAAPFIRFSFFGTPSIIIKSKYQVRITRRVVIPPSRLRPPRGGGGGSAAGGAPKPYRTRGGLLGKRNHFVGYVRGSVLCVEESVNARCQRYEHTGVDCWTANVALRFTSYCTGGVLCGWLAS
jgi:hypothetical protein